MKRITSASRFLASFSLAATVASMMALMVTLTLTLSVPVVYAASGSAAPAASGAPGSAPSAAAAGTEAESRAAQAMVEAVDSVVKIKATALANARSLRTLGREREGSGVLLKASGLVLTIGYLILEAESVEITTNGGKVIPANVVAYDHATGFGLLRPRLPLGVGGVEIGSASDVSAADRLVFSTWGGKENATLATVASKRRFAGYWEYMLDEAIFTVPPRGDHSGAALIDRNGRLVGIGSLFVADALVPNRRFPGNMFVPVDLVKPIVDELTKSGRAREAARPWLGVSSQEVDGRLFVIRVQEESPAEQAGIKTGDIILAIGGEKVESLEAFYTRLWRNAKPGGTVKLRVLQGGDVREIELKSIDRVQYMRQASAS